MSPTAAVARLDRLDRAVVGAAAAVLLLPVGLVASSLTVGLADVVRDAPDRGPTCPEDMSVALSSRGDIACLASEDSLPRGWSVVRQGD
jgi:hypothetical protein